MWTHPRGSRNSDVDAKSPRKCDSWGGGTDKRVVSTGQNTLREGELLHWETTTKSIKQQNQKRRPRHQSCPVLSHKAATKMKNSSPAPNFSSTSSQALMQLSFPTKGQAVHVSRAGPPSAPGGAMALQQPKHSAPLDSGEDVVVSYSVHTTHPPGFPKP